MSVIVDNENAVIVTEVALESEPKPELKPKKSCGEVFELFCTPESNKKLFHVAKFSTRAEIKLWSTWFRHDPGHISYYDEYQRTQEEYSDAFSAWVLRREQTENNGETFSEPRPKRIWPTLPAYKLENLPEGESATKIARTLCPGLTSYVYDAVSNHVRKYYGKNMERKAYLLGEKRLPSANNLRIRFRERAVVIRRNPTNPKYYQIGLNLIFKDTFWVDIKTSGKGEFTHHWLSHLADTGENPSGGTIAQKKTGNRWKWRISLARSRFDGEVEQQKNAIEDRSLICWVPRKSEEPQFLVFQPGPVEERPRRDFIEWRSLEYTKKRYEELRKSVGNNYRQSPLSGHGHGRNRAIKGRLAFTKKWENRVNNWIENRSLFLVNEAVRQRCSGIIMEDMCAVPFEFRIFGDFPHFRFMERVAAKAADRNLKFKKSVDIEKLLKCE